MANSIPEHFRIKTRPVVNQEAIVEATLARFTILAPSLIRMEFSPTGVFEDRPTQVVWDREQPVPEFELKRTSDVIEIVTSSLHLTYRLRENFTSTSLFIRLLTNGKTWRFGDEDVLNLKGTGRTLDEIDGSIPLEPGLISRSGWKLIDDTASLVFDSDGMLVPRLAPKGYLDLYFLGFGSNYQAGLDDFCRISGRTPLIPRWVLGNWWSRYWEYSQQELGELMQEFKAHKIPLSVCIIDMDWHITDPEIPFGGWTGYTWNEKLFPDYRGLIRFLHEMGLRTALNLHPAAGVLPHEAMYSRMAEAMGVDPSTKEPIKFDIENPNFITPYFDILHHPYEAEGIDFWWMDWQQGNPSILGINLLWWINHLHFLDLGREKTKRPFIFSRWGGLGNHRYPIGFSGDTVITWNSLAFQPYMTATAANVGFGWWSHDIGGHMNGITDAELFTRWVQFGVFSPILRLHSTKNPFLERRPWGYDAETYQITKEAMQSRHSFIPYLYSMAWKNTSENVSLARPMYYLYPEDEQAYCCPNQYLFGSELIAAPFISPRDPDTRLSRQVVWLPEGEWFDFFDGQYYAGDGWYAIYGDLAEIPVFAKAGAIVPLDAKVGWGGTENPTSLVIHVFPGADNRFDLYEDDGVSQDYLDGKFALMPLSVEWLEQCQIFRLEPVTGDFTQVPDMREYTFVFHAITEPSNILIEMNGKAMLVNCDYDPLQRSCTVKGICLGAKDNLVVKLSSNSRSLAIRDLPHERNLIKLIKAFRMGNNAKQAFMSDIPDFDELSAYSIAMSRRQMRAVLETITGAGVERIANIGEEPYLIFWNNQCMEKIRYMASYEWVNSFLPKFYASESEVLPKFKVIRSDLEKEKEMPRWIWERGEPPAIWQVSYGDLLKVTYTRIPANDPYPRPVEGIF